MNRQRWIWFLSLLGGAVAWLTHLMVSYAAGEVACVLEGSWFVFLGLSSAGFGLLGLTLFCLGLSLGSWFLAYRTKSHGNESEQYIKKFGLLVNPLFSLAIVAQAVPIFTLIGKC